MRKYAIMSAFGLALVVCTGQQSEAGCLLGWLFPGCGGPQTCCYSAPLPSCCPTTCGYATGCSTCGVATGCSSCYGGSSCNSCASYSGCSSCGGCSSCSGCSSCGSYGSASPGYSSPCGPGGCGMTSVTLPNATVMYEMPASRGFFSVDAPRSAATVQAVPQWSAIPVTQTIGSQSSSANSGWEPLGTVR